MKKEDITGIILAGGAGSRMGGVDKGWVILNDLPLVSHTLARLRPQVNSVVISANRELERYRSLGINVVKDLSTANDDINTPNNFQGPVAGILAALKSISTPYAVIVPVDAPLLAENLVQVLCYRGNKPATLSLIDDGERTHPLFGLYHRSLIESLECYYQEGNRRLMRWCMQQSPLIIKKPELLPSFANINDPDSLKNVELLLKAKSMPDNTL
ncbi:molybdenum cofactor guanylyltransferase [Gammaproteobacteria bacterium 42_54_T18]|nr:molybdenum cofactor guanylyltransferase [Gammaproteobacteria bacterium 42_54_T18]